MQVKLKLNPAEVSKTKTQVTAQMSTETETLKNAIISKDDSFTNDPSEIPQNNTNGGLDLIISKLKKFILEIIEMLDQCKSRNQAKSMIWQAASATLFDNEIQS